MSIAFRTAPGSGNSASNPISINPAATALDVLLFGVVDDGGGITFTWPASFDQLASQQTTADGQQLGVARKKSASGSEGSINCTPSTGNLAGFIASFSGVDNTTPEDVSVDIVNNNTATASAWTIDSNSITPVTSGAKIVCIMASDVATSGGDVVHSFSTVSGSTGTWTVHTDLCDTGLSSFRNIAIASADWVSGSVVVRGTGTQAGNSAGRSMATIVLRPAGGGGGGTVNSKTISDAITVSESNTRFSVRSQMVSHAISVSESIVRYAIHNRLSSDSVTITEEGTYKELAYTLQDSIDINQILNTVALHNRAISDAIAMAETVSRVAYRNCLSSDALTITETLAKWALHYRLSMDALTINEFITGTRVGIGATINTKTILDALTIIDYLTSSALHNRELTDVANIAESVSRAAYHNRSIADQIDILDALVGSYVQDLGLIVYNVRTVVGCDQSVQAVLGATPMLTTLGGYS
jgi:hypothetical protein